MKKIISLVLTLCILMSVVGCSGGNTETTPTEAPVEIKVGFGRADITPTSSVPLAGYGNTTSRMSQSMSTSTALFSA